MLRILFISWVFLTLHLHAMDELAVKQYMRNYIEQKMKAPVKKIDVVSNYIIPDTGDWEVFFLTMSVNVVLGGNTQEATVNQTVFTKGEKITFKLMKKGENGKRDFDYAEFLKPKVPNDAYDSAHFLLGSTKAAHKILIFSDPFCPYCQDKIPEIIHVVNTNPKIYGLYYYHFPLLRIHPASDLTTKAMHIFHKNHDVKNMLALYDLQIEPTEKNPQKILQAIKQKTGVTFTLAQLESEEIKEAMRADDAMRKRLQVTGTPTIFLDGMWDKMRTDYEKYAQ